MSGVYRVIVDGVDIFGEDANMQLISPTVELSIDDGGSFDFTFPPTHFRYNCAALLTSTIEVLEGNTSIFYGRATSMDTDFYNQVSVKCEGALAFLNDTYTGSTHGKEAQFYPPDLFNQILAWHNEQVADSRKIQPGTITISGDIYVPPEYAGDQIIDTIDPATGQPYKLPYFSFDYMSSKDALYDLLKNRFGGYFQTRRANGVTYLDWVKDLSDLPNGTNQTPITYGLNLSDISRSIDYSDIATQVLPLGKEVATPEIWRVKPDDWDDFEEEHEDDIYTTRYVYNDDGETIKRIYAYIWEDKEDETPRPDAFDKSGEPATIRGVNSGSLVVHNDDVLALYGPITTIQTFSQASTRNELKALAKAYLNDKQFDRLSIECKAVDLVGANNISGTYYSFQLGQMIHVLSTPHFIDRNFPISRITFDLNTGEKEISLGSLSRQTLTEYTSSSTEKNKINKYKKETSSSSSSSSKNTSSSSTNPNPGNNYTTGRGGDSWVHQINGTTATTGTVNFVTGASDGNTESGSSSGSSASAEDPNGLIEG